MRPIPRPARPVRPLLLLLLATASVAVPVPASADVVLTPVLDRGSHPLQDSGAPVLVTADGTRRSLASVRMQQEFSSVRPAFSPDGRFVARSIGAETVLLPTDGGPARTLSLPIGAWALAPGELWWDATSTQVLRDGMARGSQDAGLRCDVATGRCSTFTVSGQLLVAPLPTGGAVWTTPSALDTDPVVVGRGERTLSDVMYGWTTLTPAELRRIRRMLTRRPTLRTVVRSTGGTVSREVWKERGPLWSPRGVHRVRGVGTGPAGALVEREPVRLSLRKRTRGGRLQARIDDRWRAKQLWRVAPDGVRSRIASRSATGDRISNVWSEPAVGVPDGWAVRLSAKQSALLLGVLSVDGTLRRLPVAGQPSTAQVLHSLLGLPAIESPSGSASYVPVAYEASTGSLVVSYVDAAGRQVISRMPLDGTSPPQLLERSAGEKQRFLVDAR